MGLTRLAPADGAFIAYVDVGHLTRDSLALSSDILDRAGVAVAPGVDFDPARGGRWLRLSYVGSTEAVAEGMRRLEAYFAERAAA
jgi:aspartate/methionine/tyrosine aminotransferase